MGGTVTLWIFWYLKKSDLGREEESDDNRFILAMQCLQTRLVRVTRH